MAAKFKNKLMCSDGFEREVDPSQGDLFEGDIAGVELKAVEGGAIDDIEGQLTFGKVLMHYLEYLMKCK